MDQLLANSSESARAHDASADVLRLLQFDVSYPGWEHETAKQKAFYVRGFTWFRHNVLKDNLKITKCDTYVPEMKRRLSTRAKWLEKKFDWLDDFGARQFIDAASPVKRLTPKFHKAAECIILCEVIADDLHQKVTSTPPGSAVYNHMSIEAAVSFVHGLDRGALDQLSDKEWAALRQFTGQQSDNVFFDMAAGKTVTHKLAVRTRRFLANRRSPTRLGDVSYRFFRKRSYKPSEHEIVEVVASQLPEAAQSIL